MACAPTRSPQTIEITITEDTRVLVPDTIYVSGIPLSLCTPEILSSHTYFGQFGDVRVVDVDRQTNCAYVEYTNWQHAKSAMQTMDNYRIPGFPQMLRVNAVISRFCVHWLRDGKCNNPRCFDIHYEVDPAHILYEHSSATATSATPSTTAKTPSTTFVEMENERLRHELVVLAAQHQNLSDSLKLSGNCAIADIQRSMQKLQEEHTRVRQKNCALIRDYNVLKRKCDQKLSAAAAECETLRETVQELLVTQTSLDEQLKAEQSEHKRMQHDYVWLQHAFDSLKQSESELKELLFPKCDQYVGWSEVTTPRDQSYLSWDWLDIYEWISTLHSGQLSKYNHALCTTLQQENVDGAMLASITDTDLARLGVSEAGDRALLLSEISKLLDNELELDLDLEAENQNQSRFVSRCASAVSSIGDHARSRSPSSSSKSKGTPSRYRSWFDVATEGDTDMEPDMSSEQIVFLQDKDDSLVVEGGVYV